MVHNLSLYATVASLPRNLNLWVGCYNMGVELGFCMFSNSRVRLICVRYCICLADWALLFIFLFLLGLSIRVGVRESHISCYELGLSTYWISSSHFLSFWVRFSN